MVALAEDHHDLVALDLIFLSSGNTQVYSALGLRVGSSRVLHYCSLIPFLIQMPPPDLLLLFLTPRASMAQILGRTTQERSSDPCPAVNLTAAAGRRTKAGVILRTSRATSCREPRRSAPPDLLKGGGPRNRKVTSWRGWSRGWSSWLLWWTCSKLR